MMEQPKKVILGGRASGKMLEQLKAIVDTSGPMQVSIIEPTVKHLKIKKDIPTVIEYQGRRYILDDRNRH